MARSLLGVLLAVVVALEWGSPAAAVAAGGAATIAGTTALRGSPRGRVPRVLVVSGAAGVAAFAGAALGHHTAVAGVVFVFVVALWSVGAGLMWALSAHAGLVASGITALLVCCSHAPSTAAGAAATAGLAVFGGLTQAALVAAWPRRGSAAPTHEPLTFTVTSPILRHAIRLGGAAGIGSALAMLTGAAQGYWIAVTVLLVLRPETAHTYTRCAIRVAATLASTGLATSLVVLGQPSGAVCAVLAVVCVGISYAVSGIGYVPTTAVLAAAVVFLVDIDGPVNSDALGERLLATTLGGALAVASHVVLPDRSLVRLYQRAGELLKAEIDYAATVIGALVHPVTDAEAAMSSAWERAARARAAFEAASGCVRADAPSVRRWLMTYRAGLNAVTGSCAVLEPQVPAARAETVDHRFVGAVENFLEALRGDAPRPGQVWTLDATHLVTAEAQLRAAAALLDKGHVPQRVLVAEVETITRHLLNIADAEA